MNLVTGDNFKLFEKKNKKNILIGSWCLLDKKIKENFNESNDIIAKYHWDDKKKLSSDVLYIEQVYKHFLDQLTTNLNNFHKTDYDQNIWQIILGMWLKTYVSFLFDRWEQVAYVFNNFSISEAKLVKFDEERFIASSYYNFWTSIHHTNWNHWIFGKIIENKKKTNFSYIDDFEQLKRKPPIETGKEITYLDLFNKYFSKFIPKQNLVISSLYLPKLYKVKLLLRYNKFVMKSNFIKKDIKKTDIDLRKKFFNNINGFDDFTNFASSLIYLNLPCSFFENFKSFNMKAKETSVPQNPKMILTSTEYLYNDFFKIYCAYQKNKYGSKIIFSQHGSYFQLEHALGDDFEAEISDKFLTYGTSTLPNKTIPLFMFNVINKKVEKEKNSKGIIISHSFSMPFPSEYNSAPRYYSDTLSYNNIVSDFINNIRKTILLNTNIKEKIGNAHHNDFSINSLKKILPQISFITDKKSMWEISKKYRIVVETLNGTGFLEAMHLNIPAILLINPKINQFNLRFKNYYDQLKDANILHHNGKKAAEFVNSIYENPEKWWNDKKTQEARNFFCSKFACYKKNPYLELTNILDKILCDAI